MSKNLPEINLKKKRFQGKRVALIKANFNADITDKMLDLAVSTLKQYGVKYDVFEVVGSFEIPFKIKQLAEKNKYDGFVAIGCLIKGETDHYKYISKAVSYGLMKLSIDLTRPIAYAILHCQNKAKAKNRIKNINLNVISLLMNI